MAKKIPMRMCVGCRQMRPKKELLRIVRTPEGEVLADRSGKASGRGAYLCPTVDCLEKAEKTHALERALEHGIEAEVFQKLRAQICVHE